MFRMQIWLPWQLYIINNNEQKPLQEKPVIF